MAATHEAVPDALPYYDQGYEDSGVREMVRRGSRHICLYIMLSVVEEC